MTQCSVCTLPAARYRVSFDSAGKARYTCTTCLNPPAMSACANPFAELVLEHAEDEAGNQVRVTSLRQLRDAERRYSFKSVVANTDSANFDTPPEHGNADLMQTMSDDAKWLYPEVAESMIAEMRELGELDNSFSAENL